MKGRLHKTIILLLFAFGGHAIHAQYEEAAIKELLREAYENGYYNSGIPRNLELGFSPEFREVSIVEGVPKFRNLNDWITDVNTNISKGVYPNEGPLKYSIFYHRIDLNGDLAHIKLNLKQGGKVVAVEYLELYKSSGGWLILSLTRIPSSSVNNS